MADEKAAQRVRRVDTEEKRRKLFLESIMKGRIYECVSCHRKSFENSVTCLPLDFEENFYDYPDIYHKAIGSIATRKVDGHLYISHTCKSYITKNKLPPMSNQNGLELMDLKDYPELHLTELESCLIALNIIFQKVVLLPKSRWPATKDRIVNIPIFESDVIKTVESLPRTPSEAGIVPVSLKRKIDYKRSHKTQYVSVPKIFQALNSLKSLGNPYYQFVPNIEDFSARFKENDADGLQLFFF